MRIDKTSGERFKLALERFSEGHEIIFQDVGFYLNSNGNVECRVQTSWRIENITESSAKTDLASSEVIYKKLINSSDVFAKLVKGKKLSKVLIDDYGMGSIEICRQEDDDFYGLKVCLKGNKPLNNDIQRMA
jgi:hypothetical protein